MPFHIPHQSPIHFLINSEKTTDRSDGSKPHPLATNIPDAVIVFKHAPPDKVEAIESIDERLAERRVICERPDIKLRAGDGEIERCARLRNETDVDHCGQ